MIGQPEADATAVVARRSVEMVSLSSLLKSDSPRLSGANMAHARLLAESDADLPPILVNRRTMRVIDGTHRVLAASLRGRDEIEAQFFECDDDEAFVLAVEANVAHGLPLSLADRTAAAKRIIASHAQWSDRAVASVTGLAHKTVGSIRRRSTGEVPQSNIRRGRDGRVRPVDSTQGRLEASRLLSDRPNASLREIAREAGVCAATVRDVRARLQRGEDPVLPGRRAAAEHEPAQGESEQCGGSARREPGQRAAEPGAAEPAAGQRRTAGSVPMRTLPAPAGKPNVFDGFALIQSLRKDPSLRFSESGRLLLRLLDASTLGPQEWNRLRDNVPMHCTDMIATVARECGQAWHDFATELEHRRARQPSG